MELAAASIIQAIFFSSIFLVVIPVPKMIIKSGWLAIGYRMCSRRNLRGIKTMEKYPGDMILQNQGSNLERT
ncbi:MAG: hypothetical protein WCK39_03455 [Methanomassiliicoccales archaeon]